MNYKKIKYLLILIVGIMFLVPVGLNAKGDRKDNKGMKKTLEDQIANTYININNVMALQSNQGFSDYNLNSNLGGTVFPKGSGRTCIFESGFLWGGFVNNESQVRVGGSAYISGIQPGPILASGQADANPSDPKWRVYRVRPDIYPGGPAIDLSSYAQLEGTTADALRQQYEKDWNEWPAKGTSNDIGAPFHDKNGDGKYDPAVDVPGVPGADQTLYYVANDMDGGKTVKMYGTQPLGLEVHATFWAYAQQGALGNMYFKKYTIVNKGYQKYIIDSMFVSWWADIDLGDASDDLVGNDTTLSLTYCYNGYPVDATYAPLPPPSDGADFFQGPIVPGEPTDVAQFGGRQIPGKKNLPMTAAYFFVNGVDAYRDPDQGVPLGSTQFYWLFNGLKGRSGQPVVNPVTNEVTKFVFTGDVAAQTGWIDGSELPPGDRRQGMASGPFNMAPGDTQEVVVAEVFAGAIPGVSNIQAIALLKFYDKTAQAAYDNFFQLPKPPPAPKLNVIAQDKKVVLDWGEDAAAVSLTENTVIKGYTFQGYNVYQLPNKAATVDQAVKLATYDLVDGITKITDEDFDPVTGQFYQKLVEDGTDAGIQRSYLVSTDAFNSSNPLINGTNYFFAVTAYSYNPDAIPHAVENTISVITVKPQSPNPGVSYAMAAGDTIKTIHAAGKSEGEVFALVIDPTKLTGHDYKVKFDTAGGSTTWNITDVTTGEVKLSKQTNQSGDNSYFFVDGMMVKVIGPPTGMKSGGQGTGWDIPKGTRRFTWAGGADGLGFEGFSGAIGYSSPDNYFNGAPMTVPAQNTLLTLAQVTDTALYNPVFPTNDVNMSYGYRYLRGASGAPAQPQFAPYIINTTGGTYPYQDYNKSVPMSAWNVEDAAHPIRLNLGYLENNKVRGLVDGKYWPPDYTQRNKTAANDTREWLFIFNEEYSETAKASNQVDVINTPLPIMWFCAFARRGAVPFSPDATGEDEFIIYANHPNGISDEFTFKSVAPAYSVTNAKQDVNKINVFPNPYYGVNHQELNKYSRFVTFNHLPSSAVIRIFNLAGILVKTINHSGSQFESWDLTNESSLPVASGLYIAYIDMPDVGATKILKIAIIQEQQYLDRF